MNENLSEVLKRLSEANDLQDVSKVIDEFYADLKIGKIEIWGKDIKSIIFDTGEYEKTRKLEITNREFTYVAYELKDSTWNKEEVEIVLICTSLCIGNQRLAEELSRAPFIQFSTGLLNAFGYSRTISGLIKEGNSLKNFKNVCINLKGFGLINRIYTMAGGNKAIKFVAGYLKSIIEKDELLAHIGGDTFIMLVKKERLDYIIEKVSKIEIPLTEDGSPFVVSSTIGIADIDDNNDYISVPYMATQYAKSSKQQIVYMNKELLNEIDSSKIIEKSFEKELENGNFVVYYQTKVDLKTGKIVGAEALARWIYNGKIISPAVFIPILEKSRNIYKLDLYILENACKDISHYKKLGHEVVPLSCNISRSDLYDDKIAYKIIELIQKYDLAYEDIVIEVTETTTEEEKEKMAHFLKILNKHHVKTSLDDFGTGYSSLSTLRDFSLNEIKIDRSFIDKKTFSKSDKIIIGSIIDMASKLDLEVICEGVETFEQISLLKELGCYKAQGFFFDKPLPKLEFEAQLAVRFYDIEKRSGKDV